MRIVLPSTFWLDFQGSQALQKACKKDPKWSPKLPESDKNHKIWAATKTCKKNCQEVGKSKLGPGGGPRTPFFHENRDFFEKSSK